MAKQLAGTEAEFDAVLDIIVRHREKALNNVNVENLLTNWEIGAFISRRLEQAAWGSAAIDGLVDHIRRHDPMAKGYGRRNLYNMVAVYDSFSSNEFMELLRRCGQFVQPTAAQIGVGGIVQPVAAQTSGCAEVALDRNVKRSNENPSIGILLCKNADRSVVEYALSRTMSPAMVAEYKRMLIPKEVLQRTFDEYLALPGTVAREKTDPKSTSIGVCCADESVGKRRKR